MKLKILLSAIMALPGICTAAQQHECARIEKMPAIPQPYEMRDWKAVTRGYTDLVLNSRQGTHMPLSSQEGSGTNYPAYSPLRIDTYVGWNGHGTGSEAINVIPAVVSAYLVGCQDASQYRLTEGVMDFFNARNRQNVYLNTFSAQSGSDWWYDVMPNVYFYQLSTIAPMPDEALALRQYISVADRWRDAVTALGGQTYQWKAPSMGYRAFNLATMKPLESGVHEPESAGSIAWLLFHAWLRTGDDRYRTGAELAMEYLSSLGSNPAYELQLAYGVQAAAKMNAMLGTSYRVTKLFDNCFDRGYLRGWGSIVGRWGDYDVSGLIGEANDKGNDYAFVMNGFQQAAALAPAVKYDKRLARAFGRWMLNVANASRLFYTGALPEANMEPASRAWSVANDPSAVIPYESMKQVWNGKTPYAMGDAVGGKWAATNLSLYSGSSVGYLAAVVDVTDVEAILRLDLNATDFDSRAKYPTYLYYNPYTSARSVTVALPEGPHRIYDAITESTLEASAAASYRLEIPADGVRLITLIPSSAALRTEGRVLYAGDVAVDWHRGYDFDGLMRIKNLEADDPFPVKGADVTVRATVSAASSSARYAWTVDGSAVNGTDAALRLSTASLAPGKHTVACTVTDGSAAASAETVIEVLTEAVSAPEIVSLSVDADMPLPHGASVTVRHALAETAATQVSWDVDGGTLRTDGDGKVSWTLPDADGVYTVTCRASNVKGSAERSVAVLVREGSTATLSPALEFPFDGTLADAVSGTRLLLGSGTEEYGTGMLGQALSLSGNYCRLPAAQTPSPSEAVSISFGISPSRRTDAEQFIVSHGSWQNRYKASITPEQHLRWTVRTSSSVVDIDDPEPLAAGRFTHYTVVYTGFSTELYRDGRLVAFAPLSGPLGTTDLDFTVGAMTASDLSYNYHGLIDGLVIFEAAVSPRQAAGLYLDATTGITDVIAGDTEPVFTLTADGTLACSDPSVAVLGVCDIAGRRLTRLSGGLYIVSWSRRGICRTSRLYLR